MTNIEVHRFGYGQQSKSTDKSVLGGKGAGLVDMTKAGLHVPEGFIIPVQLTKMYEDDPHGTEKLVYDLVEAEYAAMSEHLGFAPLVSVRSGAPVSMPGMMDTVLNVGIIGQEQSWSTKLGKATAEDCGRRFTEMYGEIVLGIDKKIIAASGGGLKSLGAMVDVQDLAHPVWAITQCAMAVFRSWGNERAQVYRKLNNIPDSMGTAVVVQRMVFGNSGEDSCSGVAFSRNPSTGDKLLTGEYLVNAQGEDVVAGTHTPLNIESMIDSSVFAGAYWQLMAASDALEERLGDVVDMEFTVEYGNLYMLQYRAAKRTPKAAVVIAKEFLAEGRITVSDLGRYVSKQQVRQAVTNQIAPGCKAKPVAKGLPAGGGVVVGHATSAANVKPGGNCILVAHETTPDDIVAMDASVGILTATGGATSHAAVVARAMAKPCVTGCKTDIDIAEGTLIAIDGDTGDVYLDGAAVELVSGAADLEALMDVVTADYACRGRDWVDATEYLIKGGTWEALEEDKDSYSMIVMSNPIHPDDECLWEAMGDPLNPVLGKINDIPVSLKGKIQTKGSAVTIADLLNSKTPKAVIGDEFVSGVAGSMGAVKAIQQIPGMPSLVVAGGSRMEVLMGLLE